MCAIPYKKFQDDISKEQTQRPKPICSPNFFKIGNIKIKDSACIRCYHRGNGVLEPHRVLGYGMFKAVPNRLLFADRPFPNNSPVPIHCWVNSESFILGPQGIQICNLLHRRHVLYI